MSAPRAKKATLAAQPLRVTEASLEELLGKPGIVVLDWWADWCGPCRAFAPIFAAAAARHPDVAWGKVNTEEQRGLAAAFSIRSIPTLIVFRDGLLIFSQPGMLPAEALEQVVAAARAVDMDEVRRKVAARAAHESATGG